MKHENALILLLAAAISVCGCHRSQPFVLTAEGINDKGNLAFDFSFKEITTQPNWMVVSKNNGNSTIFRVVSRANERHWDASFERRKFSLEPIPGPGKPGFRLVIELHPEENVLECEIEGIGKTGKKTLSK